MRTTLRALQQAGAEKKGKPPKLFFPIKQRLVDRRITAEGQTDEAQITFRRRHLRTEIQTGASRQTEAPAWSAQIRPTHFLSLRMPPRNQFNRQITSFFDEIRFSRAEFAPLLIPVQKLHLTLGVMSLPNAEVQAPEVVAAMDSLFRDATRLELSFRGLGTFNHDRVLFSRVHSGAGFSTLDGLVRRVRRTLGNDMQVDMKGNPNDSYVPHITLAKIRPSQSQRFGASIPMSLWASHQFHNFGEVLFDTVDLCEMRTDESTGYYKVVHSVKLR
jgi:2'-5' RNA ligase